MTATPSFASSRPIKDSIHSSHSVDRIVVCLHTFSCDTIVLVSRCAVSYQYLACCFSFSAPPNRFQALYAHCHHVPVRPRFGFWPLERIDPRRQHLRLSLYYVSTTSSFTNRPSSYPRRRRRGVVSEHAYRRRRRGVVSEHAYG